MTQPALLPRTPFKKEDESLMGYVLRVSGKNGYSTPWFVLIQAGVTQHEWYRAMPIAAKLEEILSRESADLLRHADYRVPSEGKSPVFQINHVRVGGQRLRHPLRLDSPALCPACAQEQGYIDAFHDLTYAVACPKHGTPVLDVCPECGSPLSWMRPDFDVCRCGAQFSNRGMESVSQDVLALMAVLQAKVRKAPCPTRESALPIKLLWALPLVAIIEMISIYGLDVDDSTPMQAIEVTVSKLRLWHEPFKALEAEMAKHGRDLLAKRQAFNEHVLSWSTLPVTDRVFLREAVICHAQDQWGEIVVGQDWIDSLVPDTFLSTLTEVANRLKVDRRSLRSWMQKGKVHFREVEKSGNAWFLFDTSTIPTPTSEDGKTFETRAAANYLDLPVSVLKSLRDSGHFAVKHMPKHKTGFHQADLDAFSAKMLKASQLVDAMPESVYTLGYIMQELRFWSEKGKAAVIAAYVEGRLHSVGRTSDRLGDILFAPDDVHQFTKKSRALASHGALSLTEVSQVLGCDPLAIPALIECGHLQSILGPDRQRVTRESLEAFKERYISLQKIARDAGSTIRRYLRLCSEAGVEVMAVHSGVGREFPFVLGRDVDLVTNQTPLRQISACQIGCLN